MSEASVTIRSAVAGQIGVAFHQNAVPIVRELVIANAGEADLIDVRVTLTGEPGFLAPLTLRIDRIAAGATHHLPTPDLVLDAGFLRSIAEGLRGSLAITVLAGETVVAQDTVAVDLLPPSHWGGSGAAPELLAAFVQPNDPAIDALLRDAAAKLAAAGKPAAIDGYAGGTRQRVWELASAIWVAVAARGLAYVMPPASFERTGQKVRSPSDILERKVATCLDSTLLLAACLEQASLNPLVVLTRDHAFVGVWLKDDGFSSGVVDDAQVLRKRRDLEDVIFIETTFLTHQPPARFQQAVEHAAKLLDEGAIAPLELALDVRRARARNIRPLELADRRATVTPVDDGPPAEIGLDEAPAFAEEVVVRDDDSGPVDRLERWKRKLLDLSLRNKMLNYKDGKTSVVIECPEPARLEDLLSSGKRFRLRPRSDVLGADDPRDATLLLARQHEDVRKRAILDALEREELHTTLADDELDSRLTELFRMSRTAFEEGGANVLFLALGFLSWTPAERARPCRAPLILLPVSLQRSSVRSGFRLGLHEDEPRFNPTLIEMLRQDFRLAMPELERELPSDDAGLDVARIWQIVRAQIRDMKGWEVTPDVVLSTFSFSKFLMWKDLVDRMDLLKRNPVVAHLIDTPKHSYGAGATFPEPASIDRDHHPADLFAPLSADSSQLSAVLAAAAGRDFVLFGPPGTGKSQTIANMISQCLAHGKTVLFVSQKTAALEVVQRRLRDIGLGEYCLEVHSTKAQKSAVLGQLRTAWHERAAPTAEDWHAAAGRLAQLRDELNALVAALHRRRANGTTAHEMFGRVVAARGAYGSVVFDWPAEHTPAYLEELRTLVHEIRTDLVVIGSPTEHPLVGITTAEWSPAWRAAVQQAADAYLSMARALDGRAAAFAASIGVPSVETPAAIALLCALGRLLSDPQAQVGAGFLSPQADALRDAIDALGALRKRARPLREGLSAPFRASVFREDLRALLGEWIEATNANFLVRSGRQKQVRQKLQPFATGPLGANLGSDLAILLDLRDLAAEAESTCGTLAALDIATNGLDTEVDALAPAIAWADEARRLSAALAPVLGIEAERIEGHLLSLVTEYAALLAPGSGACVAHAALEAAWNAFRPAHERLIALADGSSPAGFVVDEPSWLARSVAIVERWLANINRAPDWCRWNATAARARAIGLGPLVDAIGSSKIEPDEAGAAFEVAYARWGAERIIGEDPVLRTFSAVRHEDAIARFRAADERVAELAKRVVRARLSGNIPTPTAFGADPEWGTLARELAKKARHQPLRQLFARIPTVLTKLTPCVMMSPLSIAQYLPPDSVPFDVVIFDEASQIPVWDAIGAIARGRQVVIVGDPEQLPPTSVGERGVDEIDDAADIDDQESILDECLASNIPQRRLDWHYRSRHESLIAFSNHHYYTGRLVTFPSPVTEDRAVRYVHVPGGVYERGAGRVNRTEARAVVADIVRRLSEPEFASLRSSLGVVTFNAEQQRLIENLLDQERRARPDLEVFFDPARWHEPVFVKNLENVQGDERDVVLFSVAVAPSESGRGVATISSLNKSGGHRRLNVAITRARKEMAVFATLRPEDIDLSRTNARGVAEFKHFLEFAERGSRALAEAFSVAGHAPDSPFEEAVKAALEARGWTVHAQIGVSGFRVDLGVVDPDAPGRYLAGVECDGATYHRSATARDRDRLREHVLTGLGWRIRRVWSTDWWFDPEWAADRLHDMLLADLDAARAARAAPPEPANVAESEPGERTDTDLLSEDLVAENGGPLPGRFAEEPAYDDDVTGTPAPTSAADQPDPWPLSQDVEPRRMYAEAAQMPAASSAPPIEATEAVYRITDLQAAGFTPDGGRFYEPQYRAELRRMVAHIIATEGPIFEDVLVQRIASHHGFARAASRIREVVIGAVPADVRRTAEGERIVCWQPGADPSQPVPFRASPSGQRDHSDVPLVELASLAKRFADEGHDDEAVVLMMARHLGLGRLRSSTRLRLEEAVRLISLD
ncbi:DUF3320 domain-containing protein [Blastochloris tepida]|uniref:DNA helicase n=1 Tax=Blastochloris tepida TaxID=2233851 RepID=A0A348FXX4_9HYPH|nr:DUF3320 domain-containing protein [Blastochloris tepida]BBF92157.1 DNA helicase [Blastochloris tepida]